MISKTQFFICVDRKLISRSKKVTVLNTHCNLTMNSHIDWFNSGHQTLGRILTNNSDKDNEVYGNYFT